MLIKQLQESKFLIYSISSFKKNLKGFYIVHPTFFFKTIFQFFKPFVSKKFWIKLHFLNEVAELFQYIDKDELSLPPSVLIHDIQFSKKIKPRLFGCSLKEILERKAENGRRVPRIYDSLMKHIEDNGLDVQGIFRLSGKSDEITVLKTLIDNDDNIDYSNCDIYSIANILKLLFREMDPPLLTYEKYQKFLDATLLEDSKESIKQFQQIILSLPSSHYDTTRQLFSLFYKIHCKSDVNKMSSENIAIVMGVNLLKGQNLNIVEGLKDSKAINKAISFMISEYQEIFSQSRRRHRSVVVIQKKE